MPQHILYLYYSQGDPKHLQKLAGIRRFAQSRGWVVTGVPRYMVSAEGLRSLVGELEPVGCIVEFSETGILHLPRSFGVEPVVYLDPPGRLWRLRRQHVVMNDNAAIARAAFMELSAGRPTSFAAVSYRMSREWARERISVFRELCLATGRPFFDFPFRSGEKPERRAGRMAKWAARLPQGCAIFGVNDFTAGEVRQALAASGRTVPESATLIGVDGVGEFPASPGSDEVSSVQIDFERAGYIAARLLARLVDAGFSSQHCDGMVREPATEVFGPLLVLRRPSTRGRFKPSPVVAGAVEIIRREASAGLTAKALAARMPGSRKHFERRFREAMGHSVLEEILHTRLEAVQTMLRRPDAPIGIVSSACGFGSDIELKRLFKRRTGMSMRQWRARFVN